jgi:23S rRNA pseudouridine1911/1915/1917 synthase
MKGGLLQEPAFHVQAMATITRSLIGNMIDESDKPDLTLVIDEVDEGQRLDTFLGRQSADCSRSHFKRLIQDEKVKVNGHIVKPGYEVKTGDRITVWLPRFKSEVNLVPERIPLEILWEDDDIVVLNKQAGIVVHPGAGHETGTLVHGLLAHCRRLPVQGAPLRPGIVHRLDLDTSGVMVVAKSEVAYLRLIEQFKGRAVRKEYLALVFGRISERVGEVRTMIARHPVDRKRMAVVESRGRPAISLWERVAEWAREVSLLRVRIETGRTHQIRVHLSHINHPIVGDEAYGGGSRRIRQLKSKELQDLLSRVGRQMLHASYLAFDHPTAGNLLQFNASPPDDFRVLLENLDRLHHPESRL